MIPFLRNWRLRRLREQLAAARARLASYDYIAQRTAAHYPILHDTIYQDIAVIEHRIERLDAAKDKP